MTDRGGERLGPALAVGGALLLAIGTWLHPMSADPDAAPAAFAEYAADPHWVVSHLMQLAGMVGLAGVLVLLARRLASGSAAGWAALARAGAVASLAGAAALQAVDGIALKRMVDRWAAAQGAEQAYWFYAAFAVRQIEVGLAAMLGLLFGLTAMLYGAALWRDGRAPRWLGLPALAGGAGTFVAGLLIAFSGFSALAMDIGLPANIALLIWVVALAATWRRIG